MDEKIKIIFTKKEQKTEDEKNETIQYYNKLENLTQEDLNKQNDLESLYNFFRENLDDLVYLYEKDLIKSGSNKLFFHILFDLFTKFGENLIVIENILKLLIDKVKKDRDKLNYILRKISLIFNQKNNINWKEYYNLLCLLYIFCSINGKDLFFYGGANIFLPLFEFVYNNYENINEFKKKIIDKLFELSTYLIIDFENSLTSNFFSLLSNFLVTEDIHLFYIIFFQGYQKKKIYYENYYFNQQKFDLFIKSFILNLSIYKKIPQENQATYSKILRSEHMTILLKNIIYFFIQISELNKENLTVPIIKIAKILYKNATIKEKIYIINLINNNPGIINLFLDHIMELNENENLNDSHYVISTNIDDSKDIKNQHNDKKTKKSNDDENFLIWEFLNSFINLVVNNYEFLNNNYKLSIMNYIFKLILKYDNENIFKNIINPFTINLHQKINLTKILLQIQNSNFDVKKLITPLEIEVNFIIYILKYIYQDNFIPENLESKRDSSILLNELNEIFKNKTIEKKGNFKYLLIELIYISYLIEKNNDKLNGEIKENNNETLNEEIKENNNEILNEEIKENNNEILNGGIKENNNEILNGGIKENNNEVININFEKENQNNINIKIFNFIKIEGIFQFCRELYKKIYTKEEFYLDVIFLIIEFIKLSNFQKKESQIIFQILFKIYEDIFFDLNENSNINVIYTNKLKSFNEYLIDFFKQKLDNKVLMLKEDFEFKFNEIKKNKNSSIKLYYSDIDISFKNSFINHKYKITFFSNLSFYYFYKLTDEQQNKKEIIKLYFKFLSNCLYVSSNLKKINSLIYSNDNNNYNYFFKILFKCHLKYISFNILSIENNEIKNLYNSIFLYLIDYIKEFNNQKEKPSLNNAILDFFKNESPNFIIENENDIELLCNKILNENITSIKHKIDSENKIINNDLYQLCNELFEDPIYIELLNLNRTYKKIKKQLFSFNGPYSNFEVFYNDNKNNIKNNNNQYKKLLYKESTHLTSEFSQPLLVPILDHESYILKDKSFNKKTIFNNINDFYQIDLSNKNNKKLLFFDKYFTGFNVCLITTLIHYQGKIQLFSEHLIFYSLHFDINIERIKSSKKICRGSFYESNKVKYYLIKYSDIKFFLKRIYIFENSSIEIYTETKSFLFQFINEKERDYFIKKLISKNEELKEKTEQSKKSNQEFAIFKPIKNSISKKKEKDKNSLLLGYYNNNKIEQNENYTLDSYSSIIKSWENNKISTLQFLMLSNILSNRSLNDMGQYPIFPWLITNYQVTKNHINNNIKKENLINDYKRDLSIPIGLSTINERSKIRKKNYLITYKYFLEERNYKYKEENNLYISNYDFEELLSNPKINSDDIPYIFGSHYSNPAYISHFLNRIFPFTLSALEIQGKGFDSPDRLFINLEKTFLSCFSEKSDLRELIPQFFYLPEMFININNLNFGKLQKPKNVENTTYDILFNLRKLNDNDNVFVDETLLPDWSDNNIYKFISIHRELLESNSFNIEKWCNLIFGVYLRGKEAQNIGNLYMYYTYWESIDCRKKILRENEDLQPSLDFFEFGQNPIQIIDSKINEKKIINDNKMKYLKDDYYLINFKENEFNDNNNDNNINNNKDIKILKKIEKFDISQNVNKIDNNQNNIVINNPINNTKKEEIKLGYTKIKNGNDKASINKLEKYFKTREEIIDKSNITYIEIEKKYNLIFCGTIKGSVLIFIVKRYIDLYKQIHDNNNKINCINSHPLLNMFIVCSDDCFVNIYTLPNVKLVSSVFLKNDIPIYSFLSMIPVPCFLIYIKKKFLLYDLKGNFIDEKEENEEINQLPLIKVDFYFNEYLEYNNKNFKIFFKE